jgi:hypothetical protein
MLSRTYSRLYIGAFATKSFKKSFLKFNMSVCRSAQDRGKWRALVNAVMNFQFHKMRGNSRLAEDLLASPQGPCSIELVCKV